MMETPPVLTPDAARSAKLVARCHHRLARQRRRAEARTRGGKFERTLLTGLAMVYVAAVTADALSVYVQF